MSIVIAQIVDLTFSRFRFSNPKTLFMDQFVRRTSVLFAVAAIPVNCSAGPMWEAQKMPRKPFVMIFYAAVCCLVSGALFLCETREKKSFFVSEQKQHLKYFFPPYSSVIVSRVGGCAPDVNVSDEFALDSPSTSQSLFSLKNLPLSSARKFCWCRCEPMLPRKTFFRSRSIACLTC